MACWIPYYFWTSCFGLKEYNLRGMADHGHLGVPYWRDFLTKCSAVLGTRDNCWALMQSGENIVLMPGGAREACKRRDDAYKLI